MNLKCHHDATLVSEYIWDDDIGKCMV